jgi:hypothetical protein
VHFLSPLVLSLTYVRVFDYIIDKFGILFFLKGFVLFIIHHERVNGLRSSSFLFSFWLLSFLASLVFLRSAIIKLIETVSF